MRRGTTPTILFTLPFTVDEIKNCEVYLAQNGELLVTKAMEDCVLDGNTLSTTLSQADTLALGEEEKLEIQARFVFNDGTVDATNVIKQKVAEILKDGEIDVE